MKKIALFCVFSPLFSLAQVYTVERPDETIEPKIYQETYFKDYYNYKNIQSIATVVKSHYTNFIADTLYVNYFNDLGLKYKSIKYDDNQIESTTITKYDGSNVLSWEAKEKRNSTLTEYFYNDKNQVEKTLQFRIRNNNGRTKKIPRGQKSFTYDQSRLIEIKSNPFGPDMIEKYVYSEGKPYKKTGGFISKNLSYDTYGNLTHVQEYRGDSINPEKLMGLKSFTYDSNQRLITDSILSSANLDKKKYQISHYTYDDKDQLKSMKVKFDFDYRKVDFEYTNSRMTRIDVTTSTFIFNSAYLRFNIDYRISDYFKGIENYKEVFDYDSFGNKTSKKIFVSDELFSEVEYIITYKK